MDLIKTIEELRREKGKLERVIASLEELKTFDAAADAPVRSRRGRKSMSPKERQEVSARMKRYWPTDSPATKLIQTKEGKNFMIFGTHVIVYSKDPFADRAFLRDVFGFAFVDAGHDWLIFALPPAEVAVHPSEREDCYGLYFMCDDLRAEILALGNKGVPCSEVQEARWGSITKIKLPGGSEVGLYQPRHPFALALTANWPSL